MINLAAYSEQLNSGNDAANASELWKELDIKNLERIGMIIHPYFLYIYNFVKCRFYEIKV